MTAGGAALLLYGTGGRNSFPAWIFGSVLLVFGLLAAGIMILIWPWKRVRWARVYEEGVRWKAGRRVHKYRWDEVTDVSRAEMDIVGHDGRRTAFTRTAYVALRFTDGTGVSFTPALKDYTELANYVQRAVAASQLAESGGELEAAGKAFGPVQISRKGVTAHGKFFA